ncbi:MAG: hypothetical protein KAH38_12820, partial [Candidatus Hydrogenedentes bacterium]|nr:hypothetical protein [Candidatus Hydrogenedentota bacterium]
MNIQDLLTSDTALTLVATLAGGVWAVVKASSWYKRLRRRRHKRALLALEAAVEEVYREYVRTLKAGSGELSPTEQETARQYARDRAIEMARTRGINLLRELGADYLNLWISRLVRKLKT